MGLLQKACETFDANLALVGKETESQGTLCPVGHILQKAQVEISLDEEGHFIGAQEVPKEASRTIIPATEKSASRTNGDEAHPLCDQLCYLSPADAAKYAKYLSGLRDWAGSADTHPDLYAVLAYVEKGAILNDLIRVGLLTPKNESIADCKIAGTPYEKCLVRWIVNGRRTWQNLKLMDAYIAHMRSGSDAPIGLCMISGREDALCGSHDKGIVAANNGAKLISSNDTSNFTYRGRFTEASQSCTISSEASQKAHRALQWVASTQGETIGGRTFVCWNPQGKRVARPQRLYAKQAENEPVPTTPTAYHKALHATLSGYRNELPRGAGIVTAVFDAATTGRLALTYYSEMKGSDFYDRIESWYQSCCWPFGKFGIESPPLKQIAECAFGTERGKFIETEDRVLRETVQRLLTCLLNQARIPEDIVKQLVWNASNPQRYQEVNNRVRLLCTACAVVRKYRNNQLQREEWTMALDENKPDRSYQFGRLLAVMETVERSTYGQEETREPNAIRLQSVFDERPLYTAKAINGQLEPYFKQLEPGRRSYFRKIIEQIISVLSDLKINDEPITDQALNRPLEDTYLMGYYLQRAALYAKKDKTNDETEEDTQ